MWSHLFKILYLTNCKLFYDCRLKWKVLIILDSAFCDWLCSCVLQVKWGPSERLWERRRLQDHHEDHLSRGCHPKDRSLRGSVPVCPLSLQSSGLQMASTHGLQPEAGKAAENVLFCHCTSKCRRSRQLVISLTHSITKNVSIHQVFDSVSVHHFGPHWNFWKTIRWIAISFVTDIHEVLSS